ncbi:YadA C-terminal domain-containing protein [Hafnia alvei]|uniref:YadA C-terminal domain-containing protein n=1 Tax=Hafnia alvei TaxID=569 RepID=UPI000B734A4B|nr:YadA C-terminal domain-containing protein [Hafnia alvei]MBI0274665.1 YadA C-terminal domain-containing protein [Hafnia alvei]PNK99298.1 hypothetical protein CEQ28_017805 [Hafnia alvei]
MKKSIIAALVAGSAFFPICANATLTGNDLAAANSYFAAHPDIAAYAPWIRDNVMNSKDLVSANYTLVNNSYYNGSQVVLVPQIPSYSASQPVSTSAPLSTVAEQASKLEYSNKHTGTATYSEPAKIETYSGVSQRPATNSPTHIEINASAMKLAQAQQEQKLVRSVADVGNNVNASAMKLAQAQQEQKLVRSVADVGNNVNASAMKLAQTQQEQKTIGEHATDTYTKNDPTGNPLVATSSILDGSHQGATHAVIPQPALTSSTQAPIKRSSQQTKAEIDDNAVPSTQREIVSEEHFNALAHAHNDNVNSIVANRSSIDTNSAAVSRNASRIDNLESQQDTDRKHANAGTANALAVSGLHYTNDVNSIAIGAGNYESENAASIGYRHTFNEGHAAITVAASEDSVGNNGVAVSGAVGW